MQMRNIISAFAIKKVTAYPKTTPKPQNGTPKLQIKAMKLQNKTLLYSEKSNFLIFPYKTPPKSFYRPWGSFCKTKLRVNPNLCQHEATHRRAGACSRRFATILIFANTRLHIGRGGACSSRFYAENCNPSVSRWDIFCSSSDGRPLIIKIHQKYKNALWKNLHRA